MLTNGSKKTMLPRPVQAVVFDMDGLLIDSETVVREAMMGAACDYGHELPMPVFLSMVGLAADKSHELAIAHFGVDFPIEDYNAAVRRAIAATEIALKPGVNELLDHLDSIDLPCAVATSSSHDAVRLHLGHARILPRFHAVVAKGDTPRGKPHPDPFLKAAERLGVDPANCLALEDSHNGVRAASAAGMMTIMVPDLLEPTAEMRSLCIAVVDTLHDVRAILTPSTMPAIAG